jgi:hypothetical protein
VSCSPSPLFPGIEKSKFKGGKGREMANAKKSKTMFVELILI